MRARLAAVPDGGLLGLRYGRLDAWLVRVEPRTLSTLPGRKLALGRYLSGWSFSPDRSRLAFGCPGTVIRTVRGRDAPVLLDGAGAPFYG